MLVMMPLFEYRERRLCSKSGDSRYFDMSLCAGAQIHGKNYDGSKFDNYYSLVGE